MEPFIDTVVICTMTALVILTTVYEPEIAGAGMQGIELTSRAFGSTPSWSTIPLSVIAIMFAFSTLLSWSYYGLKGWTYIMGESAGRKSYSSSFSAHLPRSLHDSARRCADSQTRWFSLSPYLVLGLYVLAPVVKKELKSYQARLKSGEIPNVRRLSGRRNRLAQGSPGAETSRSGFDFFGFGVAQSERIAPTWAAAVGSRSAASRIANQLPGFSSLSPSRLEVPRSGFPAQASEGLKNPLGEP